MNVVYNDYDELPYYFKSFVNNFLSKNYLRKRDILRIEYYNGNMTLYYKDPVQFVMDSFYIKCSLNIKPMNKNKRFEI